MTIDDMVGVIVEAGIEACRNAEQFDRQLLDDATALLRAKLKSQATTADHRTRDKRPWFDKNLVTSIPNVTALGKTDRALFIRFGDVSNSIPLASIHASSEVQKPGDHGVLTFALWCAVDKGWVTV